jgi:hypothetical protein
VQQKLESCGKPGNGFVADRRVSVGGTPKRYSGVQGSIRAVFSKYLSCYKLLQDDCIGPAVHQDNISTNLAINNSAFS